jgi:hypothetical protein
VREVCDLCGARWKPGADKCGECGNTRSRMSGSHVGPLPDEAGLDDEDRSGPTSAATSGSDLDHADSGATAVEPIDLSVPEPTTDPTSMELDRLVVEPQRRRSTLWMGMLILAGAVGAGAYLMLRPPGETSEPTPPPVPVAPEDDGDGEEVVRPEIDPCEGAEDLAGSWSFTTEVTSAHELVYSGVRGFYEVDFSVQGCDVKAKVTKTGYTGGFYTDRRVLRAETTLVREPGPFEVGFAGSFALRDATGEGPDQEFVFIADGEKLYGLWRQRGERWQTQGLAGFLEGEREPDGRVSPALAEQPCPIRCAVACDTMRFEDLETLDGCVAECGDEDAEIPTCGEAVPAELVLDLEGPTSTLDEHCRRLSPPPSKKRKRKRSRDKLHCEKAPPTEDGFAFALPESKLDGGWKEVRFLRTGAKDAPTVHLALRLPEGWFVSSPLLSGSEAMELRDAEIVARDLSDGQGRRHVFGYVSGQNTVQFVSCRLSEGAPQCVVAPSEGATNVGSALPGGSVSMGRPVTAPEGEPRSPGPYAW